ncbi:MAG: phosphate ABC transporter substrate-binding protein PhoT family [Bacteroidetes bacterium]|nr:MAG: phosphate ABC transporter substrate-binding protein PhoT family [Bacteroidota bacterium]
MIRRGCAPTNNRHYPGIRFLLWLALPLIILLSCNPNKRENPTDTPTTGNIKMVVDASFLPIIQAQLEVFHAVYKYAKITPIPLAEGDAFELLFKDSVRLILASRPLSKNEIEYFNSKKIFPKQVKIAVDGIAMIVNRKNPDSTFTVSQLAGILRGDISTWDQISKDNHTGKISLKFDHPHSGLVRYMMDSIAKTDKLGSQISADVNNTGVIDYVALNPGAAGLIGVSWISDRDDSTCLSFQNRIRVARIGASQLIDAYKPYQAYIATEQYPLTRDIYLISTDPHLGLADGFISFASSDKGQRIILKSGILPAVAPIRLIQVNDQ